MRGANRNSVLFQIMRLALLTVALVPVVFAGLYACLWLWVNIPERMYRKGELVFLIAAEISCALTAALSILGLLMLGCLLLRTKKGAENRLFIARGFVLCVSLLLGLALAEAVSTVWLRRTHPASALPVEDLSQGVSTKVVRRFVDPLERVELPTKFPDPPGDREIDLVVVGESSAEGVPYQNYVSVGRMIAWQFAKVLPERPIRLKVVARSGDTLEKQHQMLVDLERRPDIFVIYCGHNEFFSRLWWSRNLDYYVDARVPGLWQALWQVLIDRVERSSALCHLLRETADSRRRAIPPEPTVERDLIDVPIYTEAEYTTILNDFRRRLDVLVSYAETVGAMPILILPPGNDGDFEPNRSFLPATTMHDQREAFRREFLAARLLEASDPIAAIERYRALVNHQPGFAETHFRLARLLEQSGACEEAFEHYAAARNLDGHPMRCLAPFQEAYREVASQHGCIIIDGQSYFHAIGRNGLLDEGLFQDAMHPSLRGQIALAQAVLDALRVRRAFGWPKDSPPITIDPADCEAHFGIDVPLWKRMCSWNEWFNGLTAPLRYDPSLRFQKREAAGLAAKRIENGVAPEKVGLLNIGTPAPVPIVPTSDLRQKRSAVPLPPVLPRAEALKNP
jgi:hypothetical protein